MPATYYGGVGRETIGLEIKGLDQCIRDLKKLADQLGVKVVGAALRAEAELEMTEMKRRCPVDTGALRGSGHVEGPDGAVSSLVSWDTGTQTGAMGGHGKASDISVRFVFGGPAAAYALAVHENTEAFHPNGEAKFLERTLMESVPHLAQRVARRIARDAGV
jgi:hypothetical protein